VIPLRLAWSSSIVVALGLAAGCDPAVPPLTPKAQAVQVLKADPPEGSTDLGMITATDGMGCGPLTSDGTFEGAVASARRTAAARGANYVEIVGIVVPHYVDGCENHTFWLQGHLFRVTAAPAVAPRARRAETCDPPCSPGYACQSGRCNAVCNPPCEEGAICRQDRTCGPPPRPPASPPPGENL
jgi:hypothetical protein